MQKLVSTLLWGIAFFNTMLLGTAIYEHAAYHVVYVWKENTILLISFAWIVCFSLFSRHSEPLKQDEDPPLKNTISNTDHNTYAGMLIIAVVLISLVYFPYISDTPGTKIRYIGKKWILVQPYPDSPEGFRVHINDDGFSYKGMTKEYTYGGGKNKSTVRKYEGMGLCQWKNGDEYIGLWKEGLRTTGLYRWTDGAFYYGNHAYDTCYVFEGRGIRGYSDGYCFDGTFKNHERHGWGYYYCPDGRKFYARFDHGEMQYPAKRLKRENSYVIYFPRKGLTGFGRYYYAKGGYYQGWFKDGRFHGRGFLADARNNKITERRWNMAVPTAEPAQLLAQHTIKAAKKQKTQIPKRIELKAHRKNKDLPTPKAANATQKVKDTETFTTVGDLPHRKIKTYKGTYGKGQKPEGKGTCTFENGDIYSGYWHNGLRHGYGEIRYANGDEYKGDWKAGKRTGKGWYFKGTKDYVKGDFLDGKPHGIAIRYVNGARTYNGRWKNGRPQRKK